MARRGTDVYRITAHGAGEAARYFSRAERALQDALIAELRHMGSEAVDVLQEVAPEDTRDLIEAIVAVPFFGRALEPRVSVRIRKLSGHQGSQRDRFDYLTVTRRGHRKAVIFPRRRRALKIHIEGHRNPHAAIVRAYATGVGHASPALLHEAASRGAKRQVRAASKVRDWVAEAAPGIDRIVRESEDRLGRRIERSVL